MYKYPSISFVFRKGTTNAKGLTPIYFIWTWCRIPHYISTKIWIDKEKQWSEKDNGKVIRHPKAELYNKQLYNFFKKYENVLDSLIKEDKPFLPEYFENINKPRKPTIDKSLFLEFYRQQLAGNDIEKSMLKQHRTTYNYLLKFSKNVTFKELTIQFWNNYKAYLSDGKNTEEKKPLGTNTISQHLARIKKIVNNAIKFEYIDFKPNILFAEKEKAPTKKRVLTEEQFAEIINFKFDKSNKLLIKLEECRDLFLFLCCTGLRVSDAAKLKKENIIQTKEGLILNTVIKKTEKSAETSFELPLYILTYFNQDLPTLPEKIILKYLPNCKNSKDYVFPYGSNREDEGSYLNKELKRIAFLLDWDLGQPFTSHFGRGTYTNVLQEHIPPMYVALMRGDKNLNMLATYSKPSIKGATKHLKGESLGGKLDIDFK